MIVPLFESLFFNGRFMESKQTSKLLWRNNTVDRYLHHKLKCAHWWPVDGGVEPDIYHQYLALLEWHSSAGEEFR